MTEEKKSPFNPEHVKRYSYKENYEYVAKIWEAVAVDHPEFSDFPADDLINFFTEFNKLPDHGKYI